MAGFLRKKAITLSRKPLRDTKQEPSSFVCSAQFDRHSSDGAPPSLPPLLLSLSFADPDSKPRAPLSLPPAASPPVVALPSPAPEYLALDDVWDPWKAYTDPPSPPRLDHHPHLNGSEPRKPAPSPPQPARLPAGNASLHGPNICDAPVARPSPVATAPSPRKMSTRQAQAPPQPAHLKSDALGNQPPTHKPRLSSLSFTRPSSPPAVVRGQVAPPPSFDFEESLSAANLTSVVNQFRSYPPPIRHHTSPALPSQHTQMVIQHPPSSYPNHHHASPQKPGSSSSRSSTSHHTDASRRTNGSYSSSTSASSVSPAAEVIDVNADPHRRLDPVGSSSNSHPAFAANGPSPSVVAPIGYNPSRPFTSPNVTPPLHRPSTAPSAPPTSYTERVRPPARQTSHAGNPEFHARPPMLYDALRPGTAEPAGSLRKGPLIFAAATPQPSGPVGYAPVNGNPSPPVERAPLEASQRRNNSISSALRGASQVEGPPQQGLGASPTVHPTELLPLTRKSSRSSLVRVPVERTPSAVARGDANSEHSRPRVLTKARPTTPQKPSPPPSHTVLPKPGDPLLLDDDPFARVEGVKMMKPRTRSPSSSGTSSSSPPSLRMSKEDGSSSEDGHAKTPSTPPPPVPKVVSLTQLSPDDLATAITSPLSIPEKTPLTPDEYKAARQQRRGQWLEKAPPPAIAEAVAKQLAMDQEYTEEPPREPTPPPPPTYFPIIAFMSDTNLFPLLLSYLSYSEWLPLYSANKQVQELFQSRILREFVLARYLTTVGYLKWNYEWAEPIALSLKDLHNYLRGVAMPAHQYARLSVAYLQSKTVNRDPPTASDAPDILALANTTRAYTRLVLRLRAQAESEDRYLKTLRSAESSQTTNGSRPGTRHPSVSSRAASPTSSHSHSHNHSQGKNGRSPSSSTSPRSKFSSPLYRLGRAPVLRVFVPSPDGDWLSDAGVMECEAELKRSGVLKLLQVGDIVWDVAVGDEGNLGRLMWDGRYLVDLDYRYSRVGEVSPYFHSLAFSPSYFHRVIRIASSATHNPHCNPIVYIDVSPWGREIATNLQLLQDRARTETPHGALHDVVRWVHRSTFTIRPPVPPSQGQTHSRSRTLRVPIPGVDGFYINPGWYGTVVLESEGTHEGLADLQGRCGPGVFPPRAETLATKMRNEKEKENRRVWRILREKSRPGEIWLRAVQVKERLM